MTIVRALSLAVIAGGLALTVWGVDASHALGSEISRLFTGNPTDRSMWMMLGGVALIVAGTAGLFIGVKKR